MSCGCTTACGCNVAGVDPINVSRVNDTFYVSIDSGAVAAPQNLFIQQTSPGSLTYPYVWYEIDGDGNHITTWVYVP